VFTFIAVVRGFPALAGGTRPSPCSPSYSVTLTKSIETTIDEKRVTDDHAQSDLIDGYVHPRSPVMMGLSAMWRNPDRDEKPPGRPIFEKQDIARGLRLDGVRNEPGSLRLTSSTDGILARVGKRAFFF